jgi:hypothetical protein
VVPDERTTRATARQVVIRMISDGKEKDLVCEHVNGVENIYTFAGSLWQCGGVEGRHSKEQIGRCTRFIASHCPKSEGYNISSSSSFQCHGLSE